MQIVFITEECKGPMAFRLDHLSIRSRIILLVAGVMLLVAALLSWVLAADVRQARDAADEKARILAVGFAADIQRVLDQSESVLKQLSERPSVKALDPTRCDPQVAEYMLFDPAAMGYAVLDARGGIVCRYGPDSNPAWEPMDPDWFRPALAGGAFAASGVFVDARTGMKVVALSYPIRNEGAAPKGLLVLTMDLLKLNEQLLYPTPKDAVVTVLDPSRAILLRSTSPEAFIGSRPGDGDPDPAAGSREGSFAERGRDGDARLSAFVTLPHVDWRVAASLPQADVLAEYGAALRRTVGVGLVLCLLALALAWRLSTAIVNPIAHLRETADRIAAGNEAIRADVDGPPEMRAVARQLNQMLDARALSEARLRGIFDSAVDAILSANEHQIIMQANPAAARLFGCSLDALVGAPLGLFMPERSRRFGGNPVSMHRTGLQRDATVLRADGVEIPVEASISHVTVGDRPMYTVILRDERERKRAEEALRTGASTLQAALSSMTDAVTICDTQGRLIEINDAFATFHRFADMAACRKTLAEYPEFLDLFDPQGELVPLEQWPVFRALRGETGTNVEYRVRRKDTAEQWVGSYSFAPIRSHDRAIVAAVVVGRDVTPIRQAQADLESSHVALQRLIAAQDRVQEEERMRIARELHDDLQQTLAAIRMNLHAIVERFGDGAPALVPLVAGVDRSAQQAVVSTRRIINDLRPPMLEDLGLVPSLEVLGAQFSQQTHITCAIDASEGISDELMESPAIALSLYRIAQEALNNVAKHSGASEACIALALTPTGSVSLRVSDNGRGMPAAESRKPESFGILGIHERVRAHGGTLRIDSTPGGGTELDVMVPRATGEPARPDDTPGQGATGAALDEASALPRLLSHATHRTLQDVIDALAGNVAIVDRTGVIRFVNRTWTEFAERNGNPGATSIGPGVNYLEICRQGAATDASAGHILEGLSEVMKGDRQMFTCEYPCHSPEELRWFQMHATPMATGDIMVAHFMVSRESHSHVVFDAGRQPWGLE